MTSKGINSERTLVNQLFEAGFAAIRVPASGAGSSRFPKPDIVCGNGKRYLAFEVKTTSKDRLYINKHDIQSLVEFSQIFGAEPYLAIKFPHECYYFLKIEDLLVTRSGNYKITKDLSKNKGLTFEMLMENYVKLNFNWEF